MPLSTVLYALTIWGGLIRPQVTPAHAVGDQQEQSSPTGVSAKAAEAGNFIVSKLDGLRWSSLEEDRFSDNSVGRTKHQYYENVSIDGCEGSFRISHTIANWDSTEREWGPESDVRDAKKQHAFDASTLLIKSSSIFSTIQEGETQTPKTWVIMMVGKPGVTFYMPDREMAERVFNAFKGLAQACGAKEEPY